MFSLFKKKNNGTNVPEWASFFTKEEYSTFISEIHNYFKKLHIQYKVSDGVINADENELGFVNLGLMNVAQVCKQSFPRYYKEIITDHFDSMIRANKFGKEFEKTENNFEKVKKYIGVRLYDYEYVAQLGKELTVGKNFAGNIYSMIVYDFPDSIVNIHPEQLKVWNKTVDELFETGKNNIKEKYSVSVSKEKFGDFSIWFAQGEHFFTPNIVFDIENKPNLIGSKGSLIGIPHRHSVIIYPIENLEVVKAVNTLIPAIHGMHKEGPGSLSNNLFWYKDGDFIKLPYEIGNDKLSFFPPEEFVEMLNELDKV